MQDRNLLTSAIDEWLADRPAATRRAYIHDVQEFISAVGGNFAQLDEAAIRRWLATFERRHLAPATMRRKLAAVRSFLRFLHERKITARDLSQAIPTLVRPSVAPAPAIRTTERGRHLAAALHVAEPRLKLLLWLVGCGCPLPAIAQLRWQDLQQNEGEGIAICHDDRDRPLRCVIPGIIWRSLEQLKASASANAPVFTRPDGTSVTPQDLADTIGWVLEGTTADLSLPTAREYDRFLTLSEVAQRLGLPETTVRYYRDRFAPYLPVVGEGRSRRYPPQAVERLRWIVEQLRAGSSVQEIEAQLRSRAGERASSMEKDTQFVETVDRLSQRISELTESLLRVARALEEHGHFLRTGKPPEPSSS
ncbi:MAG: MerR family transcriptional regulator [Thermomicrobium sp.]